MTIAIVPWDGKVLTIELCDTAAAGVMTGRVISSTQIENGFTKSAAPPAPIKIKRRRSRAPSDERLAQANRLRDHLKEMAETATIMSAPAYATTLRLFPKMSGGSVQSLLRLGVKKKFWRYNQKVKPAHVEVL